MNWYLNVLSKYAEFDGRARRQEYWMFGLINFMISFAIGFIEGLFDASGVLSMLYLLAMFIPCLAVSVRRLHDIGKSGWYCLVLLIPVAGAIWFFIMLCTDSEAKTNQYGPNPKSVV